MKLSRMSAAFCSLGCKVNQYETDAMTLQFEDAGYEIREFDDVADVYIVNTCTVTSIADRKSRQMLRRARKRNPDAFVVAVGCYVQTDAERIKDTVGVDLCVGNNLKSKIVDLVTDKLHTRKKEGFVMDLMHDSDYENMMLTKASGEHTRAYIKIQDGCNQFCSYCIIPYARGRIRSRRADEVGEEVKNLINSGIKEIVLTGIHVSSYGMDFPESERITLIDLIEYISRIDSDLRIRLSSLEQSIITEDFLSRASKIKGFCPHFHLSLQSGCDETLKRMNRHYDTKTYKEKCDLIRKYFDRPALTTDIIAGFPGETDEEFSKSYDFVKEIHFSDIHVFKYSKRDGTRAAAMPDQIDPAVMTERSNKLIALGKLMRDDFLDQCIGMQEEILSEEAEEENGRSFLIGHTKNYIRCRIPENGFGINEKIIVSLDSTMFM